MKSQFSELSYAYALTENLVHTAGIPLISAPMFPSTVAEGKKGGGYDLKLPFSGLCMFLQFKLSHCMSSKSSKEFTSGKFSQLVGKVKQPVYRIYLHPLAKSRQTSLLLKLEHRHGFVYYVAPLFHLPKELNSKYIAKTVSADSRFIRPSTIKKMPDQLEHFVSFRSTGRPFRFSNDPVELDEIETQESLLERIRRAILQKNSDLNPIEHALTSMFEAIEDDLAERARNNENVDHERYELKRLRESDLPSITKAEFIARTYFDSQLLTFCHDAQEALEGKAHTAFVTNTPPVAAPLTAISTRYFQAEDLALRAIQSEYGAPVSRQVTAGDDSGFDGVFTSGGRTSVVEVRYVLKEGQAPEINPTIHRLRKIIQQYNGKITQIILVLVFEHEEDVKHSVEILSSAFSENAVPVVVRAFTMANLLARFGSGSKHEG